MTTKTRDNYHEVYNWAALRFASIAALCFSTACVTTAVLPPLEPMVLPASSDRTDLISLFQGVNEAAFDLDEPTTNPLTQDQVVETLGVLQGRCAVKRSALQADASGAQDAEVKTKVVIGSLTGGLAAIGSLIAGSLDVDTPEGGGQPENPATSWSIGTAIISAAGAVVVAIVSPGKNRISAARDEVTSINSSLVSLKAVAAGGTDPTGWEDDERAEWAVAVGLLLVQCAKS